MRRGLKPHLFKGAYAALKGRSFTAVYTLVCFSAACKADVKNEPAIAALKRCDTPKSCRKKETGRLGPASGASVEMRLHRSLAPLNQEIVRAQFTSVGCVSRQPELTRSEAGMDSGATVGPVADSVQWFQMFL